MPLKAILQYLVCSAGMALVFASASSPTTAGGFAVREQSTSGLGAAFAGVAAGYDLSSIFWNSAGVSIAHETMSESHAALLVTDTHMTGTATLDAVSGPSADLSFLDPSSGDFTSPAFVSAMYSGMPINSRVSVGFGLNSPFGLTTKPDNDNWVGKFEAETSKLFTLNLNPVTSYQLTERLALGAGVQFQYIDAKLKSAFPGIGGLVGPNPNLVLDGDDFGVGYTLGLLWNPMSGTSIGLGFRSSIEHSLDGTLFVAGVPTLGAVGISAELETPEIVTASIRQKAGERLTLLGTIEWTNWSDLTQVVVKSHTTNLLLGAKPGDVVTTLPLHWEDGWFFSVGAELELNERTTLRTGVAYEESPIRNATQRVARLPDTNRTWVSVGATYHYSSMTSFDIGYSHIFFEDGLIDRDTEISGLGSVNLLADVEKDSNIVAASVRIKFGEPPAPITK